MGDRGVAAARAHTWEERAVADPGRAEKDVLAVGQIVCRIDAVEIFFETVGDQLGIARLSHWYSQFGLGSKTEIGLAEATGRIPSQFEGPKFPAVIRPTTWFASIGQGQVLATPIQMANVAATVARNGVWVRPRLVVDANDVARATTRPATKPDRPDRVELPIAKETIAAIQEGMYRVVYGSAGTGTAADKSAAVLCGRLLDV